jgi:hypothetical protein
MTDQAGATQYSGAVIEAWQLKTHALRYQWAPHNPGAALELTALLDAIEVPWTNHGGLLRVMTTDGLVELHDRQYLDVYPNHTLRVPAHVHDHRDHGWRQVWCWTKRCACGHEDVRPTKLGPLTGPPERTTV